MKQLLFLALLAMTMQSCISENYSNGERIGFITKFSNKGILWKSWDGEMNITQTGMNTSSTFDFSVDNDNQPEQVVKMLDSAANLGWKVKLIYHETFGKNWLSNRGETDHFVKEVIILDRHPMDFMGNKGESGSHPGIRDTIYVVIRRDK